MEMERESEAGRLRMPRCRRHYGVSAACLVAGRKSMRERKTLPVSKRLYIDNRGEISRPDVGTRSICTDKTGKTR